MCGHESQLWKHLYELFRKIVKLCNLENRTFTIASPCAWITIILFFIHFANSRIKFQPKESLSGNLKILSYANQPSTSCDLKSINFMVQGVVEEDEAKIFPSFDFFFFGDDPRQKLKHSVVVVLKNFSCALRYGMLEQVVGSEEETVWMENWISFHLAEYLWKTLGRFFLPSKATKVEGFISKWAALLFLS